MFKNIFWKFEFEINIRQPCICFRLLLTKTKLEKWLDNYWFVDIIWNFVWTINVNNVFAKKQKTWNIFWNGLIIFVETLDNFRLNVTNCFCKIIFFKPKSSGEAPRSASGSQSGSSSSGMIANRFAIFFQIIFIFLPMFCRSNRKLNGKRIKWD